MCPRKEYSTSSNVEKERAGRRAILEGARKRNPWHANGKGEQQEETWRRGSSWNDPVVSRTNNSPVPTELQQPENRLEVSYGQTGWLLLARSFAAPSVRSLACCLRDGFFACHCRFVMACVRRTATDSHNDRENLSSLFYYCILDRNIYRDTIIALQVARFKSKTFYFLNDQKLHMRNSLKTKYNY